LTFVLVSQPVLTTSTYVVAWPQGDQLLGGGPWHKANLSATHWLSLPFYTPEGAWRLSWQLPEPKGRPSWLRVPTGLFHPAFSEPPRRKGSKYQDCPRRCLASQAVLLGSEEEDGPKVKRRRPTSGPELFIVWKSGEMWCQRICDVKGERACTARVTYQ
jgi:hypothetical protein